MPAQDRDTAGPEYTSRLATLTGKRWKRLLNVQAPYQWNHRRLLGTDVAGAKVLDVGCGIGRNLPFLPPGSVGVDHNADSVRVCREQGLDAVTTDEFLARDPAEHGGFTGLLAAHLLEHLPQGAQAELLRGYLPYLAPGARVVLICPQRRGYASDDTHLVYLDLPKLRRVCEELGLSVEREMSFPLPPLAGRWFLYNEWITAARYAGVVAS